MTKFLRLAAAAAAIATGLGASATAVGTQVQLTDNLLGKVLSENGHNHDVAVLANPDNKPSGVITINAVYFQNEDNYTVTHIADNGFAYTDVQYINAPATLEAISTSAFQGCTKLRGFHEAEVGSVKTIGASAFDYCMNMTSFNFPGVEYIGNFACRRTALTSVELPAVKTLGAGAFQECQQLEAITVGDQCTSIGNIAISNCPVLKAVTVHYGVQEVGATALAYNVELPAIVVPYTLEASGNNAFFGSAFKKVYILSPDFMNYCDASGLLRNRGITDIYCLASLADGITRYQNNGSGETTSDLTSSATVHTLDDLLKIENLPSDRTAFKLVPMVEGISDIKVLTEAGGREVTAVDGVYTIDGKSAFLSYTVDGVNVLEYPVDGLGYTSGIAAVEAAEAEAPAQLYDLQGRPAVAQPAPGLYIRRSAAGSEKIIVK